MPMDIDNDNRPADLKSTRDEIVIFQVRRETCCEECGENLDNGEMLRVERGKALCLACADLEHLEFLPRGDTAITRRATRYSPLHAVVVRWSSARKRYERQGILADPQAIRRAEEESLADADLRARRSARAAERRAAEDERFIERFAAAVCDRFPGCPRAESLAIARHACLKYSGRVGRSAASRAMDPGAIQLAVVAHVRHEHTNYDRLLGLGGRQSAREAVADKIDEVLRRWRAPQSDRR